MTTYTNIEWKEEESKDIILSIVIPCYKNESFTKSLLKDLIKLPNNHEIIIFDNAGGETDTLSKIVGEILSTRTSEQAQIVYINHNKNIGFSRACNKAQKDCRGSNILFLNNDVRVTKNYETWTSDLIEQCHLGNLVAAQGGLLDAKFNFIKEMNSLSSSVYSYLSGWCLAGSKETLNKLKLDYYCDVDTDEIKKGTSWGCWRCDLFYFNDPDLSWRARKLGIQLKVINLPLHHFGRMTSKKLNLQDLYLSSQKRFKEIWKNEKNS